MVKQLPDKFMAGLTSAALSSFAFYLFIEQFIMPISQEDAVKRFLAYPRPYLMALAIQAILLRIFMVNFEKEKFSMGWILGVFIFALYIFYGIHQLNHV